MLVSDTLKAHIRNFENQVPFKDYCKKENFLGKGGYGEVYRGKFDNNRDVAIKRMEIQKDKYKYAEVELHFTLRNENVLNCLGVEKDDLYRYYIFDLAAGTMSDLFTRDRKNTELGQRVQSALTELQVLHQMASGLAYLHSEGIVHGDIKPENILISLNDPVLIKLADFGLCKEITFPGRKISQTDLKSDLSSCIGSFTLTTIRGTPGWTPPESIKVDERSLKKARAAGNPIRGSTASDVFAYGLVSFYYLTKGIHPFGDYPCIEDDIYTIIIPNIFHNKPIYFEKIDLPVNHPTRVFILKTIKHEENERPTAHAVLSEINILKSENAGRNITIDTSTFEKLIENRERWNFAEVWKIKTPSAEASASHSSNSFSQRVIKKYQMKTYPPSFLDAIRRKLYFPFKEKPIEDLRSAMNRAVDNRLIDTVPTTPLILFENDGTINISKVIVLVVPISDFTLLNSLIKNGEEIEQNRPESTFYCVFCISYSSENVLAVTRLFGDGWSFLGFMKEDPIEVAFRYYKGFNLLELLEHLIKNDVNMKFNYEGWNALHLAFRFYKGNQMREIVIFLVSRGIDLKAKVYNMHNANALHILCMFYSGVHLKEIIELLVENGINPIEKATEGWSALHLVCRHFTGPNMKEIIQLLISYGINVNEKLERKSMTALHFLCQHYTGTDLIEIIDLFVKSEVDIKATDDEGWNVLHFVCAFYYKFATNLKDIIDLLIHNGIDPCATDHRGWQVLHIICRIYNREDLKDIIVSLLKRKVDLKALTLEYTSAFYFLCRNYTRSNLKEIVHLFYDNGFRMERVEFEWAALVQVCFVNRGPSEELLEIVRRITEEIMQRDQMNAKTHIDQALDILSEFNLDLDRKEVVEYLKLVSEI